MNSKQWKKVNDIFHKVLEHERSEWPSLLDGLCGDDLVVKQEVASLLATYVEDPDYMERESSIGYELNELDEPMIGTMIGSYQLVRRIGSGGMGVVYLGVRNDLQMYAAIKFIWQGADTETVILAKLEHPNIARLYDAGRTDENVSFFVMEYVENGQPIDDYCRNLALSNREKLVLFRKVCAAVHFAHQNQIVHCDLKPKNILVTPDGEPKLLDFGVAAMVAAESGQARGKGFMTLAYAAPEQCGGDTVTTATDIYALGVLFYELLTDRWPYHSEKKPEDLKNTDIRYLISYAKPYPPESTGVKIRNDLKTILSKCLNKKPEERYDSAHGLAEDLRRFANREPLIDKSNHFAYVFWLWFCRYKLAVGFAMIGFFLISAALAWGAYQRAWTRQERIFEQMADQIESKLRLYYQLPTQNIGGRLASLREELAALETSVKEARFAGKGPGNYALGRGYLAMGDLDQARTYLRNSWEAGYQEPVVAYYLGRVLAELYLVRLRKIHMEIDNRRVSRAERGESLEEAEALSVQASRYLMLAVDVDETEYVQALLAFGVATRRNRSPGPETEADFNHALDQIQKVYHKFLWYHEAYKLEGDLYLIRGYDRYQAGQPSDALSDFQRSETAYREAAAIARSAPQLQIAIGALQEVVMQTVLYGLEGDLDAAFQKGKDACRTAMSINPGEMDAYLILSLLYTRLAEAKSSDSEALGYLQIAVDQAHLALGASPGNAEVFQQLGAIYRQIAHGEMKADRDPIASFEQAIIMLQGIPERLVDYRTDNLLGLCFSERADYEINRKINPLESWSGAIKAFSRATQKKRKALGAPYNLGNTYLKRGAYLGRLGADPSLDFKRAQLQFEKVADVMAHGAIGMGNVSLQWTEYLLRRGKEQEEQRWRALTGYAQALSLYPAWSVWCFAGAGQVFNNEAIDLWMNGSNPETASDFAMAAYNEIPAVGASAFFRWANKGEVALHRAGFTAMEGRDPGPDLERAVAFFENALNVEPYLEAHPYGQVLGWMACAWFLRAEHQVALGQDPGLALSQAQRFVSQSLAKEPSLSYSQLIKGKILVLKSFESERESREALVLLEEAGLIFDRLALQDPDNPDLWLAQAARYRRLVEFGHDASSDAIICAILAVERALSINPFHGEAHGRRAVLLWMRAKREADRQIRDSLIDEAEREIDFALSVNANLRHRFSPFRTKLISERTDRH